MAGEGKTSLRSVWQGGFIMNAGSYCFGVMADETPDATSWMSLRAVVVAPVAIETQRFA